jgi:hypothetical protein
LLAPVEECRSQVLEDRAIAEQVVDDNQQAVGDGNRSALGTAAVLSRLYCTEK